MTPAIVASASSDEERLTQKDEFGTTRLEDFSRESRVGMFDSLSQKAKVCAFYLTAGTYGIVFKATHQKTGRVVALKRIRLDSDGGCPATAVREIALLKELSHPNVVQLLEVIHTMGKLTLVFEYMPYDLKHCIDQYHEPNLMPMNMIKSFLYQLLRGIAYIHNRRILHRDIKPQNLLVSNRGELKICDFGLARAFGIPVRSYTHEVVTLWYRSPDVLLGNKRYGTPIDVWSVGCVFAEMVTGKPLFPGRNERDQLQRIYHLLGTPKSLDWPELEELPGWHPDTPVMPAQDLKEHFSRLDGNGIHLLSRLLEFNPERRITARAALHHPFFSDLQATAGDSTRLPLLGVPPAVAA